MGGMIRFAGMIMQDRFNGWIDDSTDIEDIVLLLILTESFERSLAAGFTMSSKQ